MSRYLCTFSGKYGDILWSLPTARFISENIVHGPVDFAVMPYYTSLLPLLASQNYIDRSFTVSNWIRTHSNHGDQPWQPPEITAVDEPYLQQWHLGYRAHPGISAPNMPLIDFVAYQQGVSFNGWNPVPFITVDESVEQEAAKIWFAESIMLDVIREKRLVTYSFNDQYVQQKKEFFEALYKSSQDTELKFFNVGEVGWKEAAWLISKSIAYVGCRSANWVLANGLAKETITYEPHPSRHRDCHLGRVFGCPYGKELALPFAMPPATAGDTCASLLKKIKAEQYAGVT
jgi:hypothetical protein